MIPSPTTDAPRSIMTSLVEHNLTLTELKFEEAVGSDGDTSSMIWVILFSILMVLSILSNTMYIVSLSCREVTSTHIIIALFFIINLVDYILMLFEFSLGPDSHFPYSGGSCSLYQYMLQLTPLLTAAALLILILQAAGILVLRSRKSKMAILMIIFIIVFVLLLPTLVWSELAIYPSSRRNCVMDMSSMANMMGMDFTTQHILTALYYIIYKSIISFWLPSLIILLPVIRMFKRINTDCDKNLEISLSIAVAISFIVFYFPLATVVTVRQIFLIQSEPMDYKEKYLMDVLESLFKLLSFFFHVFRPLVCLVLIQGASITQETLFLNDKLRYEEKKLLKTDEEN